MFRVEQNVPDVYVQESRDFQLFSRLYDLAFQCARFSIDSMEQISDTMRCNDKLLPLIASKVGFFTDLNLTTYADRQLLSAFPYIIRYKGSLKGIQLVANLFERIMNVRVTVEHDPKVDTNLATIVFHQYAPDVTLLYALLEYIRPTGFVVEYAVSNEIPKTVNVFEFANKVTIRTMKEVSKQFGEESAVLPAYGFANNNDKEDVASNIGFTQIVDMNDLEETNNAE